MLNFFFKCVNFKHPDIKFTMEKETNKFSKFLEVFVKSEVGHLVLQCIGGKRLLDVLYNIIVLNLLATKSVLRSGSFIERSRLAVLI